MSAGTAGLAQRKCVPCRKGTAPLTRREAEDYLRLIRGWQLDGAAKSIGQEFVMKDFLSAVQLMDQIARVAESEDHHPDLHVTAYRRLRVEMSTHSIGGLSENDFILAAKIDQLPKNLKV